MNTQNTCCSRCGSPKCPYEEKSIGCSCECHHPKAVQSEVERDVKEFGNNLAFQLKPSNDTMEAVRLVRKELLPLLTTYQHRIEEARKEEREKAKQIVVDEHYRLEEWLADSSKPKEMALFEVAQETIKTRNAITKALTPKEPNDTV